MSLRIKKFFVKFQTSCRKAGRIRAYFKFIIVSDAKDGSLVSLKARSIKDSVLGLSFVCISDFVFDTGSLVVKPVEEQLQKKLENVKSLHLSIYSIVSIEELGVDPLKFQKDRSNLVALPNSSSPK